MNGKQMAKQLGALLGVVLLGACVSSGEEINKYKELSKSERKEEAAKIKTQLAVEYVNARDYRLAVATIEEAVKTYPKYDMAWLVRAQIYQYLKTYPKAEESFAKALSLAPKSAEINNNYGWYLCSVKKQAALSIKYFDKALSDPTYPTPEVAYFNKGICSAKAGQGQLSDTYFEQVLAINPEFVNVYKEQARAKLNSQQIDEADRLFRIFQSRVEALSADDLLLGWKIARAQGQTQNAYEYEAQLKANFPYSEELHSIGTGKNE